MRNRTALLAALALLGACGESHVGDDGAVPEDAPSSTSFAGAYLTPECAPDDGEAYTLLLWAAAVPECSADGTQRSLSFYIFEGAERFFPIEPTETVSSGSATLCPGGEAPCRTSSEWSVTFDDFVADSGASGSYSVTFDGGETITGTFDASWCAPAPLMCG